MTQGNGEAMRYAQDFLAIFQSAKWDVSGIKQDVYTGGEIIGIQVLISAENGALHRAPIGAGKLIVKMIELGLIKEGFSDPGVMGDAVEVRIGRKPPP